MAQQKFTIDIPTGYSSDERNSIGIDIIERIIERSQSGKDKNGQDFVAYSEGYKKSFEFKLAGKGESPNLTLTGEMLNAMTVLETSDGSITIGYREGDDFNNGKAEGNITGSYGKSPNPKKARDFLGISSGELDAILTKYPISREGLSISEIGTLLSATRASDELADAFFGFEDFGDLDEF
jgi:hypothetical protein